ncbi:hypothetical protein [Streptomyces cucumeris]|uniref:hypothetical protein n=1 Tax=Streptomyces cucumeris TaxID=2962890 RepID=UPI0020C91A4D|nr:hypothetical protein [Streptomyces sp. NEAU-Y11]MCP9213384.1 hypothetical protein [Streptomyces sp. NEAU-Y11]
MNKNRWHRPCVIPAQNPSVGLTGTECVLIIVITIIGGLLALQGMPIGTIAEVLIGGGLVGHRLTQGEALPQSA